MREPRLAHQPIAGAEQLMLRWIVVGSQWTIRLGAAPTTHRHSPIRLRHVVLVELSSDVD